MAGSWFSREGDPTKLAWDIGTGQGKGYEKECGKVVGRDIQKKGGACCVVSSSGGLFPVFFPSYLSSWVQT